MARIITITSGKGGVGKTTITANLGTAIALTGKKVCLIDADFGLRNLDIHLGLSNRIVFDISDLILGRCKLEHVMIKDKNTPTLSLIPSGKNDREIHNLHVLQNIVATIAKDHDYILIDSPAGIESGFKNAISVANEAIIVVTPDKTSIQDADRIIGILEDMNFKQPQCIINMAKDSKRTLLHFRNDRLELDGDTISNTLKINELGRIFMDPEVSSHVELGKPIVLHPQFETSKRFRHIAQNVINEQLHRYVPPVPKHFQNHKVKKGRRKRFMKRYFS